ncbi:MAG: methyltransferase domain-containing protein [Bacteroidetes bacterium]|jgi:S-adenosylmethionine-diacylgycerolhomoserine-N-methlytransferase|nr:methyltransferase domain-containing protein [Bacteroidota bacterium]
MEPLSQQQKLQSYYKWHAHIYDASRWSFLFGRRNVIKRCKTIRPKAEQILEIGCGTGSNLRTLRNVFPTSQITGCDLSSNMLRKASKKMGGHAERTHLEEGDYLDFPARPNTFDLILFSYILTMVPDQFHAIMEKAYRELQPDGLIAIVDFHSSPSPLFTQWMQKNHVRLNHQWDDNLKSRFTPCILKKKKAYAGVWNYFQFVGSKS